MINESTQDPNKPALLRTTPFEKENSLNLLQGTLFYETKDFDDLNNNLTNFKTKGFPNSIFPNYNSNLSFLGGYGHSMFGGLEKHDILTNNCFTDLNSNKKDISFSKKPLEFEFSNQNGAPNFHNSLNLAHNNYPMNSGLNLENNLFYNNSANPLIPEESHFNENEKNIKSIFSQNLVSNVSNKLNMLNSNFEGSMFGNKETSKRLLPVIGNLEEEPRYVNEKQYKRMMIRRIKRAKEILTLKSFRPHQQPLLERNSKKRYKYESRHLHAAKRPRDSNGKFLKKEKLSMQEEHENNLKETDFFREKPKEKHDFKVKKIRKTNNPKNFKHSILLKENEEKSPKNEKLNFDNKEEINESYYEETNNIGPFNESLRISNELDADDKHLLNLNLSFIKKEEDG